MRFVEEFDGHIVDVARLDVAEILAVGVLNLESDQSLGRFYANARAKAEICCFIENLSMINFYAFHLRSKSLGLIW